MRFCRGFIIFCILVFVSPAELKAQNADGALDIVPLTEGTTIPWLEFRYKATITSGGSYSVGFLMDSLRFVIGIPGGRFDSGL